MISTVFRTDLKLLWRERSLQTVIGLTCIFSALAIGNCWADRKHQLRQVEAARADQAASFRQPASTGLADVDPVDMRDDTARFRALVPPSPLSLLAAGSADVLTRSYLYEPNENATHPTPVATGESRVLYGLYVEPSIANPRSLLTGRLDLAFCAIYILPLLVIGLTYNMVAAEREAGILALALAQPVSPRQWMLGKAAARALPVSVFGVLLPAIAVAVLSHSAGLTLALWVFMAHLYLVLWLALSMWMNARKNTSLWNLLALTTAWVVVAFLAPALSNRIALTVGRPAALLEFADAARTIPIGEYEKGQAIARPLRSEFEKRYAGRSAQERSALWLSEPALRPTPNSLLEDYLRAHPEWPAQPTYWQVGAAIGYARVESVEKQVSQRLAALSAEQIRVDRFSRDMAMVSPATLVQVISSELAGVDSERHRRFLAQLDAYARERQGFYEALIAANHYSVSSTATSVFPLFRFEEEEASAVARRVAGRMSCLAVLSIALSAAAIVVCSRRFVI